MNAPINAMAPFFELGDLGPGAALIAAVAIGIAFGWTLERAGLGSAPKLAGQFYFADLTVFKVMFSAIVTAMLGAFWLGRLGLLDLSRVYVPETYLLPQLAGGLLFGIGFVIAGLCPGTSCVAAATGRGDGLLVMFGMFAGVLGTGLAFGSISNFYASTARGSITLPQLLGVPYGAVVFGVVAMALIAFWLIRRFEAPASASAPVGASRIRALAVAAALCGALAVFAGSPYRAAHATVDVQRLASAVAHEEDHVTAIELAEWIRGRKAGLRIVDLRTAAEFETYHLPRAERIALESLATAPLRATDTIVLISGGGAHAAQAWVLLQALGFKQVYFLRGGLQEWIDDVMNPTILATAPPRAMAEFKRVGEISRYFGGVPRIVDKLEPRPSVIDESGDRPASSTTDAAAAIRRRGC
jgi:rhodanese-related sulfurtransferase/uncharacterized membrane protein YedE/YeeE